MSNAELLTPEEIRFCVEYTSGPHATNGTKCAQIAYPHISLGYASVKGSELLKRDRINTFLAVLRARALEPAIEAISPQLREWSSLLAPAQQVVIGTMEGKIRSRLAYDAARYVIDRVLGSPQQNRLVQVRDEATVGAVLNKFMAKLALGGGAAGTVDVGGSEEGAGAPPPSPLASSPEFQGKVR